MTARRSVDHVILYVEDLDESIAFYRDVVGLEVKLRDRAYAEFVTDGTKFGLFPRRELPGLIGREAPEGGPAAEVLFLVEDVDAEAARLRRSGAAILAGPTDRPWGHRTVHIADPDGNIVEFAQQIPRGG
jgi:lactoylglutathione lyase